MEEILNHQSVNHQNGNGAADLKLKDENEVLNVDQFLQDMKLSNEDVIKSNTFQETNQFGLEFTDLINVAQAFPNPKVFESNPTEQLRTSFAMQYKEAFKNELQLPVSNVISVGKRPSFENSGAMNGINGTIGGISSNENNGNLNAVSSMANTVNKTSQMPANLSFTNETRNIPQKRRSLQHVGHDEIVSMYFDNESEVFSNSFDSSLTNPLATPSFGDSFSESNSPQLFARSLSRNSSRDGHLRQRSFSFQHGVPQRVYTPENNGPVFDNSNTLYNSEFSNSTSFHPEGINASLYRPESNSSMNSMYTPDSTSIYTDQNSMYQDSMGMNFSSNMMDISSSKPRERAHSLAVPVQFTAQYPSLKRRSVSGIIEVDPSLKRLSKVTKTRKKQTKSLESMSMTDMPSMDPTPRQQKLKAEDDMYTPKWVRYQGAQKEGLCEMCEPGKWLQLKNSAFWYHKQFIHGISSVNGRPFPRPDEIRLVWQSESVSGKLGLVLASEGHCPMCMSWLLLSKHKKYHSQAFSGGVEEAVKNLNPSDGDIISYSPLKILVGIDHLGNPRNLPTGFSLGRDVMSQLLNDTLAISWYRHSFKCCSAAAKNAS